MKQLQILIYPKNNTMLRMPESMQDQIREALQLVEEQPNTAEAIQGIYQQYKDSPKIQNAGVATRWQVLRAAQGLYGRNLITGCYELGLNDSQINSALKHLLRLTEAADD